MAEPIIDRIKYDGPADVLAWKYPKEDISNWSQLIVNESQEAILYRNGQALDLFKAGRYTLDTPNIPLLEKIINIPTGGKTPTLISPFDGMRRTAMSADRSRAEPASAAGSRSRPGS